MDQIIDCTIGTCSVSKLVLIVSILLIAKRKQYSQLAYFLLKISCSLSLVFYCNNGAKHEILLHRVVNEQMNERVLLHKKNMGK